MTVQWFYGRGTDITGPMSGKQLSELAACGHVLQTDTVWQEGVECGVLASKVKNLFPVGAASPPPGADRPESAVDSSAAAATSPVGQDAIPESPAAAADPPAVPDAPRPAPARTARAIAGRGAVIIGQDGRTVKYRGKCTTCGKEDSSWKSIAIPRGLTRASFFCPKCRKRQEVEIQGIH